MSVAIRYAADARRPPSHECGKLFRRTCVAVCGSLFSPMFLSCLVTRPHALIAHMSHEVQGHRPWTSCARSKIGEVLVRAVWSAFLGRMFSVLNVDSDHTFPLLVFLNMSLLRGRAGKLTSEPSNSHVDCSSLLASTFLPTFLPTYLHLLFFCSRSHMCSDSMHHVLLEL